MARPQPLPARTTPWAGRRFDCFLGTLGFSPDSVRTLQPRPRLVQAPAQRNALAMDPQGEVEATG